MRIVADENIPFVQEAFSDLGTVETRAGRSMTPEVLKDAEMLLVRSVTKVNADLLDGTAVRFVATATIGEDHIDKSFLAERGIAFSSAPGCNADSVADYITSALVVLSEQFRMRLPRLRLGIVGVGNVGSRVLERAKALGMTCVLNDPPRARAEADPNFRPIEEIWACDIVSFHVPLTKEGEDATFHLANAAFLGAMKPGAILFNSARGSVVHGNALGEALASGRLRAAVLDVWESEPAIDPALLDRVAIGTPHIAGYSFDGKVNGTRQIYEAACAFLGKDPTWDPSPLLPAPDVPKVQLDGTAADPLPELQKAVLTVYDVRRDDEALRGIHDVPASDQGAYFDQLRKEYPRRREFKNTEAIVLPHNQDLKVRLQGLHFKR